MKQKEAAISAYIDLTPTHARDPMLRSQLEEELRQEVLAEVPKMVSRLAELHPIIATELGEHINFLIEAQRSFRHAHWRAVVAMVGTAAENFSDSLYSGLRAFTSPAGITMTKTQLFGGRNDKPPEKQKLAILSFTGLISQATHDRLVEIKALRDRYVHARVSRRNVGADARRAISLFNEIIQERFNARFMIKDGKIVPRQSSAPEL